MIESLLELLPSITGSTAITGASIAAFYKWFVKANNIKNEDALKQTKVDQDASLDELRAEYAAAILEAKQENDEFIEILKRENNEAMAKLIQDFDEIKSASTKYTEKQLEVYSELWKALNSLEVSSNTLWDSNNPVHVAEIDTHLKEARNMLNESSFLINEEQFRQVSETCDMFEEFVKSKNEFLKVNVDNGQVSSPQNILEVTRAIIKVECWQKKYTESMTDLRRYFRNS